jgi:iron complex transport system substrate-binding protein
VRIVALLPSATEIVCALGLEEQLVGVTHECDHPASVARLPHVTRSLLPGTASSGEIDRAVGERRRAGQALYALDLPVLQSLRPDLIVTQALCGVCAVAEDEVRQAARTLPGSPRVVNLEPRSLSEVFRSIRQVAAAAGVLPAGEDLVRRLTVRVEAVAARSARIERPPRAALLEWLDPPFSCGHWSPEIVRLAGGAEGFGRERQPSRRLSWDEIVAWRPEVVCIACCGFDVERTLADVAPLRSVPGWLEIPAVRAGRVVVTDGSQYFSRPGPRLVDSLEILAHVLNPAACPLPAGLPRPVRVGPAPGSTTPGSAAGSRSRAG